MTIINVESIKTNGTFLGHIEDFGYLYQVGNTMFVYNGKDGLRKL